jgi:arginase family enzyme
MLVVKIPSGTGALNSNKGTEKAPDAIAKILKSDMVNEQGQVPVYQFKTVEVDAGNIEKTHENIYRTAKSLAALRPLFLGGDHSLTFSTFKAFSERHDNAGMVVFDAHPDLMEHFAQPTHDTYLRELIEQGLVQPQNVIIVGNRACHAAEYSTMQKMKIKNFSMRELSHEHTHEVCDSVMAAARNFGVLYLSIDIDVVDSAFAPGTGHCEPGGMSSRELLYFLQRIRLLKNLRAIDLVEVNPDKDIGQRTVNLAGKIILELS